MPSPHAKKIFLRRCPLRYVLRVLPPSRSPFDIAFAGPWQKYPDIFTGYLGEFWQD